MLQGLPFRNEKGWWPGHSGRSSTLTVAPTDVRVRTRGASLLPGNLLHAYAQMSIMNA